MCKQHSLWFQCDHAIYDRLSTCSFKKSYPSSHPNTPPIKGCLSQSYLHREVSGDCPSCRRNQLMKDLDYEVEVLRLSMLVECFTTDVTNAWIEQPNVADWREEQFDRRSSSIPRFQPTRRTGRDPTPVAWNSRKHTGRKTSLLSREFKPEDVCGPDAWDPSGYESSAVTLADNGWGGSWSTSDSDSETDVDQDESFPELSHSEDDFSDDEDQDNIADHDLLTKLSGVEHDCAIIDVKSWCTLTTNDTDTETF